MKIWNETREVLGAAQAAEFAGHTCAIVVLTNVKGSAFRRPGAKLLIRSDGTMSGNVSGGCLENDLRERALACLASGRQETVHYNTGSDEDVIWGLGLGCDGELDLLIVPVPDASWIVRALERMKTHTPFALRWSTVPGPAKPPAIIEGAAEVAEDATSFHDPLIPPPDLVIIGAGDDAIPLVDQAVAAGFRVTVVDHRSGYLSSDRFPRAHAVVNLRPENAEGRLPADADTLVLIKNHALEMDKKWAAFFDRTPVRYIGLLGPQKRCGKIRELMTAGDPGRVFGPAGLDIGSEGAEQIALSILAQLLAVWNRREPIHLHQREGPIHGRPRSVHT